MIWALQFVFEFRADRRNSAAIFGAGFWLIFIVACLDFWLVPSWGWYLALYEVSRPSELPFSNYRRFTKKPLVAFALLGNKYLNFQRSVFRVVDGVFVYILYRIFLFGLTLLAAVAFALFGRRLVPFYRHFNYIYICTIFACGASTLLDTVPLAFRRFPRRL